MNNVPEEQGIAAYRLGISSKEKERGDDFGFPMLTQAAILLGRALNYSIKSRRGARKPE
jgi:hypothetical protein